MSAHSLKKRQMTANLNHMKFSVINDVTPTSSGPNPPAPGDHSRE